VASLITQREPSFLCDSRTYVYLPDDPDEYTESVFNLEPTEIALEFNNLVEFFSLKSYQEEQLSVLRADPRWRRLLTLSFAHLYHFGTWPLEVNLRELKVDRVSSEVLKNTFADLFLDGVNLIII